VWLTKKSKKIKNNKKDQTVKNGKVAREAAPRMIF